MRSTLTRAHWYFPAAVSTRAIRKSSAGRSFYSGGAGLDAAALSFRIAAIRETFEESGILLARPERIENPGRCEKRPARSKPPVTEPSCVRGKTTFLKVLSRQRACCWRSIELVPLRALDHAGGHAEAVRYLVLSSPPHRRSRPAHHDGKESTDSIWLSPREALAGGESGRFKLPFPTTRNLIKLGGQPNVQAALDDSRGKPIVTVMPVMTRLNGGRQLRIPLEAGYDGELFEVGAST